MGKERTGWINVKDRERLGNDLMPEGNNVRGEDYKKGEVHGRYLQTHYHVQLHNMVLYSNYNKHIVLDREQKQFHTPFHKALHS